MAFRNAILAGIKLIREAIQSPNYVAGTSGWSINQDGSAEFSDITLRGDGVGDTVIVGPAGGPQVQVGSTSTFGYIRFPTNRPIEDEASILLAAVGDQGQPDEYATFQLQGPSVTGADDSMSVLVNSQRDDGSTDASVQMMLNGTDALFVLAREILQLTGPQLVVVPDASAFTALVLTLDAAHTGSFMSMIKDGVDRIRITQDGRLFMTPDASANSTIFVDADSAHTGNLLRLQLNAVDQAVISGAGNLTLAGALAADNVRHGTAQTPAPGAGGGTSTVNVSFANAMSGTPRVTIDPVTTVDPATVDIKGYVDSVSSAGFTIRAYRSTNSATNWSYTALST